MVPRYLKQNLYIAELVLIYVHTFYLDFLEIAAHELRLLLNVLKIHIFNLRNEQRGKILCILKEKNGIFLEIVELALFSFT